MIFSGLTLDLDATYILVLVLFLLPLVILNGIVFGPFMKLFQERHERLEGALARAGARLDEAEVKAKSFEEQIKVASSRGVAARDKIRAEAQANMARRLEEERKRMADKLAVALREVEAAKATGLGQVTAESKKLAEATAAKLLGRQV